MTPGLIHGLDGIDDRRTWQFRTRPHPRADVDRLSVDTPDGGGDFCTVQGAIDFVPVGNEQEVEIEVGPGHYREIVYVAPDKPHLTGAARLS